jgi:hypothetical protein
MAILTLKNSEAIAEAIAESEVLNDFGRTSIAENIAARLAALNPTFDAARFIAVATQAASGPPPSDRYVLVAAKLRDLGLGTVEEWITRERNEGSSWAGVSFALRDVTGIVVSYETLRRWAGGTVHAEGDADAPD